MQTLFFIFIDKQYLINLFQKKSMNTNKPGEVQQPNQKEDVIIHERFHNSSKIKQKLTGINDFNQKLISTQSIHHFLGPAQKLTYGRFLLNKDQKQHDSDLNGEREELVNEFGEKMRMNTDELANQPTNPSSSKYYLFNQKCNESLQLVDKADGEVERPTIHRQLTSSIMTESDLQRLINDPEDSEFGDYLNTYGQSSIQEMVIMNIAEDEDQVIQMDADEPDLLEKDTKKSGQRFQ